MQITKQFLVSASPETVWEFITTPEKVAPCIPGCSDVEVLESGSYRASIAVSVGPIKARFAVIVQARIETPPEYAEYVIQGEEGGNASRLSAVNILTIKPAGDDQSEVSYVSDVNISGRLGKFGAGVMKKISDSLGEKFIHSLKAALEDGSSQKKQKDESESTSDKSSSDQTKSGLKQTVMSWLKYPSETSKAASKHE